MFYRPEKLNYLWQVTRIIDIFVDVIAVSVGTVHYDTKITVKIENSLTGQKIEVWSNTAEVAIQQVVLSYKRIENQPVFALLYQSIEVKYDFIYGITAKTRNTMCPGIPVICTPKCLYRVACSPALRYNMLLSPNYPAITVYRDFYCMQNVFQINSPKLVPSPNSKIPIESLRMIE